MNAGNLNASSWLVARRSPRLSCLTAVAALVALSACGGGSGGSDVGDIAQDGLDTQVLANDPLEQGDLSCIAEIDIAEFFLTEIDRQWSCDISSVIGTRFDEVYFERSGTANFTSSGVWYWNRNLPTDDVNLAAPDKPSTLITDIGSSNTLLVFRTISDEGVEESYDCVLVSRELDSLN